MLKNAIPINKNLKEKIDSFILPSELGFGKVMSPIMVCSYFSEESWSPLEIKTYEDIKLDPSSKFFHYGQQIFEGLKAYRYKNSNPILFRPEINYQRFCASAKRMAMPVMTKDHFISSIENICYYLKEQIPQKTGESLYIRPFMFAIDPGLGLQRSSSYLYLVIASPSASYFSSSRVEALIEREDCRAAPGGTGAYKVAGNYGASIRSSIKATELNYQQTLWLDARYKKYIEEFSGMNFFAYIDGCLLTPKLTSSILPGVTRRSVMEIAQTLNIKSYEEEIDIDQLISSIKDGSCKEIFACGTAAIITPVHALAEITGEKYELKTSKESLTLKLRDKLMKIQRKETSEFKEWTYKVSLETKN